MTPFLRNTALGVALYALLAPAARAEASVSEAGMSDEAFAYVAGTILSVFYHELGHALIDTMDLPLYGPEEDAADTLAAVLTHEIWDEEGARQNAEAFALSWLASAAETDLEVEHFAGLHSLDLQRHYRQVCLFYGAAADTRADFARDFELPEDRAAGCADEYASADHAWGAVLRGLREAEGEEMVWTGPADSGIATLLKQEVTDLNGLFSFPVAVAVRMEVCDEANAFYLPDEKSIVICQEFVDYLVAQAEEMEL
ncbi:DUF4344 domain-containing metallopeptidase [Paracoccus sp. IB05]|uniref:DUF4344 domain-containing metallopeptidase n=1 Tax=Paracoccus sp. IB05 TaxID=2779367 RepID=UPI0018E6F133|nr:DUF4344 domain-containing metallopeptidase [Paracoccus sp. IB05]MBJ2150446.1 hypothetical protein [Paracoccus sp. IB05]